jgi:hypothetical protein
MTVGEFIDMYRNIVSVAHSSNIKGGLWLTIRPSDLPACTMKDEASSHLSVDDARVLIALLEKGIAQEEDEDR